ncbi:MAG: OB-fold putative lipoprotein [Holophagales bacterium]|jgi:hypothetical protein|nr:OB-fold putative lipoprotein [Holophagales bacterium]
MNGEDLNTSEIEPGQGQKKKRGSLACIGIGCGSLIVIGMLSQVIIPIILSNMTPKQKRALKTMQDAREKAKEAEAERSAKALEDLKAKTISVVALHKEYPDNEVAADDKYKRKTVVLIGKVDSINKDMFDNLLVLLETGDRFNETHAEFNNNQKQKVAGLRKGQKIWFMARVDGLYMGSVMLKKCKFVQ